MHIYYKVWNFFKNHDILEYFNWFYDTGENLAMYYNDKISIVLIFMMIADTVLSITNAKKQIVKWIFYVIIAIVKMFIGFVASPEFYESV